MLYTLAIQKAIRFSMKTHEIYQKQKRKGKDIPYITHPLTVGLILSRAGASEDVVVAGILHDTIEDSIPEKKVTKEMIQERFGKNVAELVVSVTETQKEIPWEERKREAYEHIKEYSEGSLLLKSADILANTSDIVVDYEKEGDKTFLRFNGSKDKILGHYIDATNLIISRWEENPLSMDLKFVLEKLKKI